MRMRGRLTKLTILASIITILYKASTWQQYYVLPAKGTHRPVMIADKPRPLDLQAVVSANTSVRFRDWADESMDRYEKEPACKQKAKRREDVESLLLTMSASPLWGWMANRIGESWPAWQQAGFSPDTSQPKGDIFHKKNILIIPGILRGTNYAQPKTIAAGGPLGELLQWADLIAGLHLLGHNITLETDYRVGGVRLLQLLDRDVAACSDGYDLIFVDILSMEEMPPPVRKAFRCRFRVLDVYGTQAMYNDPDYSKAHGLKSRGGGLALHLKQFYTFYPSTPDNSFLGFVVRPIPTQNVTRKENIGVLYGKDARYARGRGEFVSLLTKYTDVHYTMSEMLQLPTSGSLINEGVISSREYGKLLDRAKLYIGLGEPIEGTGAMEALAHGCVFINPRFDGQTQMNFIERKKPSRRLVTSQIPYLQHHIGPPHVQTIDIYNTQDIIRTVKVVLNEKNVDPLIPEEFTMRGYLTRLSSYIEYQQFCTESRESTWPPVSLLQTVMSITGGSCEDACIKSGLVCEPTFFRHVNKLPSFTRFHQNCSVVVSGPELIYPAIDTYDNVCWLQEESTLFSCAVGVNDFRRVCPCRAYRRHQVALW